MTLAPIIIFAYDRPEHLRRTIEALAENVYATDSTLYIFCDGPKAGATEERELHIKQVRDVAHAANGFKEIHMVEAKANKGLANSIIGGVTDVIAKHGRAIVLEDDLLTSPYFLKYMNEGLERYDSRKSVFTICANRPLVNKMAIPTDYEYDVFVSQRSMSTGWATWADRWLQVDWSLGYLPSLLKDPNQIDALNRAGKDLLDMLQLQRDHKIDSWAVQYGYAHFANHAVAIMPCVPYVDNIGFDGTGIHSWNDETDFRNDVALAPENPRWLDVLYEDKRIINAFYAYCNIDKLPFWKKAIRKIYRMVGAIPPACVEPKVYM